MKWRFRLGVAAGNALEYYDVAVFAAISPYLSAELMKLGYHQATEMVLGIFALRFLIRPFGGYVIGLYAENFGKKSALILTSSITGMATLCMALLPEGLLGGYTPFAILVLQLALSFSFAGEFPSLITYLQKSTHEKELSKVSSIVVGSSIMGVIASLGIVYFLKCSLDDESMQDFGWRIPLLVGLINIAISFWFRAKLPEQPKMDVQQQKISWRQVCYVYLFTIPGTVTFYSQSISTSVITKFLDIGELKDVYAMFSNILLLLFIIICGWLTDKYSSSQRVFKLGTLGMIFFSIPLYFLLESEHRVAILLTQFVMTIYSAMILCNLSAVLAQAAIGQVITLGIGYNLATASIGGVTPLIVSYLGNISLVYVGGFITLCGVLFFITSVLPQYKNS